MKGFDWLVPLSLAASLLSARVDIQFILDIAKQVFVVFLRTSRQVSTVE